MIGGGDVDPSGKRWGLGGCGERRIRKKSLKDLERGPSRRGRWTESDDSEVDTGPV